MLKQAERSLRAHLLVLPLFAIVSVWLTWPLVTRLSTHLPGVASDDNVVFLWNIWWMRHVLADGQAAFLHTRFLFFPEGVDLVLHTHTALNALAGATILGWAPLATALNLTLLATGALNGFSAYLLAWRASGHRAGSIAAGTFFAASPVLVANLFGHFNFYTAWGLGLFGFALIEALDRGSWRWAVCAGVLLAAVAYTDYYYFVYLCALTCVVFAHRWLRPGVRTAGRFVAQTFADRALLTIAGAAVAGAVLIRFTGGFVFTLGSLRVSMTTGTNLRAVAAAAFLCWLWRRRRPTLTTSLARDRVSRDCRLVAIAACVAGVIMLPLIAGGLAMWRNGQYVSQAYVWRSAPAGVDAATIVTGNPFNAFWGTEVTGGYLALGMNPFDGPLWMGIVPVVLVATRKKWLHTDHASLWLLVMSVFLVWALGPYLLVFGVNTGLPLPQMLLRYAPIVANARIPSHAAIVVVLGASVLLAMAVSTFRPPRSTWLTSGLVALIMVDSWAAPFPTIRLDRPEVYVRLASLPMGGVLEIPFGIRDGFGEEGRLDPAIEYYQTLHQKPLVGGYVSRLPPAVKARYQSPVFDTLLRLSAGQASRAPVPENLGREAGDFFRAAGVKYVVVHTRTATPAVREFVGLMPVRLILDDGTRRLYEID